ncbi:MAG: hypothetical protein K2L08_00410, partial [Erysipelotrichaceae bacterium]|nr:hypothetical protein [Erysipelotrichaceae bacterium]
FDLSTNPGLEWVTVNGTKTSGINISGLTNLSVFSIAHTDVTGELDFSGNTALTELYVNNTKITSLNIDGLTNLKVFDVSGNPDLEGQFDLRANKALEVVNINTTKISDVDVTDLDKVRTLSIYNSNINKALDLRTNTALKNLYASNSQITDLNIDGLTNLVYIDISNNKELVCELDLRGNPNLEVVYALSTKVSSIDITGLAKLKTFSIHNTNISQDYDFTSNPALEYISIHNLNIHNINVQGLSNLTTLYAGNTKITGLDVSTNPNLQLLHCNANLTWLNIGNNPNLTTLKKRNSVIDLGQIGDSFHITTVTEAFKGIDPSKVTMVSGATYDETTGEVSGYQNGTPIVYRYDSGTMANNQAVSLEVTLNFTTGLAASTISINNYEGKVYDGTPVSKPSNITAIGSSGAVTFEWFKQDENGQWVSLGDQAPVNAGRYGVKAHLAADANYEAADSGEPVAFTIAKAETKVSIEGKLNKEYDGKEVEVPTIKVEGNTGLVTIEWYQKGVSRAWELIPGAPKEVGEYKIVVKVEEDENYLGVEVGQTFAILEKGEVPSTPEEGEDNTTTEEEKVEGVQTGDVTQTSMWTMLVGLSMSMMYFLKRKKKG